MKFELKTENDNYSKSISKFFGHVFRSIFSLVLIIIFCDVAMKIRIISRHYQIDYYCRHLSVNKSKSNFKKLSKFLNIKVSKELGNFVERFLNNI